MLPPISRPRPGVAFSLVLLMVAAAPDGVAVVEDGADPWLRRAPGGTGRIRRPGRRLRRAARSPRRLLAAAEEHRGPRSWS